MKYLAGVPDDDVNKITHENAMRLFRFDPFAHRAPGEVHGGGPAGRVGRRRHLDPAPSRHRRAQEDPGGRPGSLRRETDKPSPLPERSDAARLRPTSANLRRPPLDARGRDDGLDPRPGGGGAGQVTNREEDPPRRRTRSTLMESAARLAAADTGAAAPDSVLAGLTHLFMVHSLSLRHGDPAAELARRLGAGRAEARVARAWAGRSPSGWSTGPPSWWRRAGSPVS